jgi:hypothetical protein
MIGANEWSDKGVEYCDHFYVHRRVNSLELEFKNGRLSLDKFSVPFQLCVLNSVVQDSSNSGG